MNIIILGLDFFIRDVGNSLEFVLSDSWKGSCFCGKSSLELDILFEFRICFWRVVSFWVGFFIFFVLVCIVVK